MVMKKIYLISIAAAGLMLTSCDKVSPTGILIGNTSVDDRVEMSASYLLLGGREDYVFKVEIPDNPDDYTFLVGSDSHMTTDAGRLQEMMDIMLNNNDLMCCHLGDIVDTKPEYFSILHNVLEDYRAKYAKKKGYIYNRDDGYYYVEDDKGQLVLLPKAMQDLIQFPFYVTVGNHDITHNGWALFKDDFKASFFQVLVPVNVSDTEGKGTVDRFIFLDSANGSLGSFQTDIINSELMLGDKDVKTRNLFVFTHTNFFRPQILEIASTFCREEQYFLLEKFSQWKTDIVFAGHVHMWDERVFGGVQHYTLESMSERNSPKPGDYLLRVHVKGDGKYEVEKVHMDYVAPKK